MNTHTKLWLTRNQNKIFTGIVIVLAIVALVWTASPPSENSDNSANTASTLNGRLKAVEDAYDFGTISMAGGKVNHAFKVRNTSNAPVVMRKLSTSCMCTTGTLKHGDKTHGPYGMPGHGIVPTFEETINPGEEVEVDVVFDPAAHGPAGVGRVSRVVYLETVQGPKLEFKFSAMVTP